MVARDQLRAFVERVERIEESIKDLNADKSEIYAEAKGSGFDVPTIKKVVHLRKMDANERAESDALLDTYLAALGMISNDDAPSRVHVHVREGEITEPSQAHTEVGSEQAAASAPLEAAADHSGSSSGRTADFDSANGGSIPSPEANSPETATKQRENVPSQHEARPGSASLGTEQQCDTLGVTAGRDPQPHSPGTAASPVALVIHHDESREARSLRLRPHCQHPSACAGVGTTHCYSCKRAITSMNGGDAA